MKWLKSKIVGAWNYSRIIFINVAYALAASASEIVSYFVGFEWDAFFRHEIALVLGVVVNIATVVLRQNTYTPVGASPEVKAEAEASMRQAASEEPFLDHDLDVGHNPSPKAE